MANINIAHIAYGSFKSPIGAATLGYSTNVSGNGRSVDGAFIDENGRLSSDYSSLLWRYYPDTDSYMLTHVQGHYVEDMAMARFFAYRDASEVTRNELLTFGFPLANVMQTMPRIESFDGVKSFPLQYTLQQHKPVMSQRATQLMQIIYYALANGLQLYVGMATAGRPYRDNGIFDSEEWKTLVEAIDKLDITLRQYVSFAFCVDGNYAEHLSDKVVVFYAREGKLPIPDGCVNIQYEQIPDYSYREPVQMSVRNDGLLFKALSDREEVKPLSYRDLKNLILEQREIRTRITSRTKSFADYSKEEYQMWRNMGHRVEELQAADWGELKRLLTLVGGAKSKDGIALLSNLKEFIAHWPIDRLNQQELHELYNLGILEQSRMNQQLGYLFSVDLSRCADAESIVSCVDKYSSQTFDPLIVDSLAQLKPGKDDTMIEELLKACSVKKKVTHAHKVVEQALDRIAGEKAQALGASVERWYKFLSALSRDKERPRSEKLYLAKIQDFDPGLRKQLAKALDDYAEQHSKNAKKYAFRLMDAFTRTKPGQPVDLPPRDAAKAAGDTDIDTSETAERLHGFLKKEQWKRILHWLIPILLLALLIAGALLYFFRIKGSGEPAAVEQPTYGVSVSPGDEEDHLLYKLACFRPEVQDAMVNADGKGPEKLNITDIVALSSLDKRYTQFEMKQNPKRFTEADFVTFEMATPNKSEVKKDTIRSNGESPFLPKVCTRHDRVHEVLVYLSNEKDTICIDIPNTKVFDAPGNENTTKGLSSSEYFLWLVRTVEKELSSRNLDYIQLAY